MPHRFARPIVMCNWEALDTHNEAEYLLAMASWGDLIEEVEMCPGVWASEGRQGVTGLNHEHRCKAGEDGECAHESDESETGGVIREVHSASGHIREITVMLGETKEVVEGVEGTDWSVVEQDFERDQAKDVVCVEGDEEQVCDSQEVRESTRANTTWLNPHAAECCPRPRIPMIFGPEVQQNIQLHSLVKMSGMPNFEGCRVPIKTAINVEDIEFLEFGFPISFEGMIQQTVPQGNRRGARDFPEAIDDYVRKECELGATLGPFDHNLLGDFPLALSPLNSVPKSKTWDMRNILDLSFPPGSGINDGIARNIFSGGAIQVEVVWYGWHGGPNSQEGPNVFIVWKGPELGLSTICGKSSRSWQTWVWVAGKFVPGSGPRYGLTDGWHCLSETNEHRGIYLQKKWWWRSLITWMTLEVQMLRGGHRDPLSSCRSCWRRWGLPNQGPRHVLLPQGWFSLASCLTRWKWWWKWRQSECMKRWRWEVGQQGKQHHERSCKCCLENCILCANVSYRGGCLCPCF